METVGQEDFFKSVAQEYLEKVGQEDSNPSDPPSPPRRRQRKFEKEYLETVGQEDSNPPDPPDPP